MPAAGHSERGELVQQQRRDGSHLFNVVRHADDYFGRLYIPVLHLAARLPITVFL